MAARMELRVEWKRREEESEGGGAASGEGMWWWWKLLEVVLSYLVLMCHMYCTNYISTLSICL